MWSLHHWQVIKFLQFLPPPPHHCPSMLTLPAISLSLFFWPLHAVWILYCSLLTAPFLGDFDVPSRLPWWECSLPPPLFPTCVASSIFKFSMLFPSCRLSLLHFAGISF